MRAYELNEYGKDSAGKAGVPTIKNRSDAVKVHRELSPEKETAALARYTKGSRDINDKLHQNFHANRTKNDKVVKSLDKAMTRQTTKDMILFTGVKQSLIVAWKKYGANLMEPIRLHLPAYTSTSTDFEKACGFASPEKDMPHVYRQIQKFKKSYGYPNVIAIRVPKGTPCVSVMEISHYDTEDEILLPRGIDILVRPEAAYTRPSDWGTGFFIWYADLVGHRPMEIA